jgi:glycerol-3-phosphate dehydrogenase
MAEDLNWSRSQQRAEVERATKFLASMGLPPGIGPPPLEPHSLMEKFWALLGFTAQALGEAGALKAGQGMVYSRAQFEAGELTALHDAFTASLQQHPAVEDETHLGREDLISLIRNLKGYEGVSQKVYEYVLTETGFVGKSDFGFEEFVEVGECQIGPVDRAKFVVDLWRASGYRVFPDS